MGAKPTTTNLVASDYVHLHNHTHHSLLDGLTKIPELVQRVKEHGMQAVAMTDHGNMSGAIEFYKACKAEGIKPIIGMEAYVAARSRTDRDPAKDKARYHLIILAMNHTGYQNLMQLSSKANLEGMYYKPRIDHELLEKYNEGLIILSACASGEIGENMRSNNYAQAKRVAEWYKSVFGDRYYLELQDHGHYEAPKAWAVQVEINKQIEKLAEELSIEMVVTSDAHYIDHADQKAHEILLCVGTAAFLSDKDRMSLEDFDLHVTDPAEIIERWSKTNPRAVANTKLIADRCDLELELGRILIPKFPVPEGETEKTYLDKLVFRGLARRYNGKSREDVENLMPDDIRPILSPAVLQRIDMELEVCNRMGYNGYFLIVQDFINWGKDQGIVFGPGRGSAAGSILAYSLRITELDPLEYDLLFERFLNPDRISMPDIDIDIQDTRRDEVIQYCTEKYGQNRVANIVTFGRMAARAAVRDVARVLQVPYAEADRLSKMIPPPVQGRHIPLKVSLQNDADLKKEYETSPVAKEVFDYAVRLEGTIRSHGVHAAGVVIAPDDIVKYVPLEMAQKGVIATQYPMYPVEEIGLLKMDFLGLSNLSIIKNALRIIKKVYKNDIDLGTLPLDDKQTYELFQRGDTTGVFQLESAGMKRYLKELKPSVFDDIIAMVALYRPGPMQFIDSFIKRKHGEEPITYLHEGMRNSLQNTYGILVYQEQFMQISKEWCGFTGGQADTLRKAVGKKNIEMMQKVKPEFVAGAVSHGGATKEMAEKFWDQLEEFANYCFNKSHAACYGLISYWTAYLKAHYPDAFMAAVMTSDQGDLDRLAIEINECNHMGLQVQAPDVNESFVEFAVVPGENQIRFGMAAVKGVGVGAVEEILRARDDGKFTSIEDFAKRVSTSRVNRRVYEALIKTGGFDSMGNRSDLLFNLENLMSFASKLQKEALSGQVDLFGAMVEVSPSIQPTIELLPAPVQYTEKEQLTWERELLGLFVSSHPLDHYDAYFEENTVSLADIGQELDGRKVTVGGLITTSRMIVTKNGGKMSFVGIEDKLGEGEIIVFPKLYEEIGSQLAQDMVIKVIGKVSAKDREGNLSNEVKIIADEITVVTDKELMDYQATGEKHKAPKPKRTKAGATGEKSTQKKSVAAAPAVPAEPEKLKKLFLHVKDPDDHKVLIAIKKIAASHLGATDVVMVLGEDKSSALRMPFRVEASRPVLDEFVKLLSDDCVILK